MMTEISISTLQSPISMSAGLSGPASSWDLACIHLPIATLPKLLRSLYGARQQGRVLIGRSCSEIAVAAGAEGGQTCQGRDRTC